MLMTKREHVDFRGRDKTLIKGRPRADDEFVTQVQLSGRKVYDYSRERKKYEFYSPAETQDFQSALNSWKNKEVDSSETIFNPGAALAAASVPKIPGAHAYATRSQQKIGPGQQPKQSGERFSANPTVIGHYKQPVLGRNGYKKTEHSEDNHPNKRDSFSRTKTFQLAENKTERFGWTFTKRAPNYIPGPSTTDSRQIFAKIRGERDDSDYETADNPRWRKHVSPTYNSNQPLISMSPSLSLNYKLDRDSQRAKTMISADDHTADAEKLPYPRHAKFSSNMHMNSTADSAHVEFTKGDALGTTEMSLDAGGISQSEDDQRKPGRFGKEKTKGDFQGSVHYRIPTGTVYETPAERIMEQPNGISANSDGSSAKDGTSETPLLPGSSTWDLKSRHPVIPIDPSPPIDYDRGKKKARSNRQYSFASADADMDKIVAYQPNHVRRSNSSKSNPNVSFSRKPFSGLASDGDSEDEVDETGVETIPHDAVLLHAKAHQDERQRKVAGGLFSEDPSQEAIQSQTTDMSQLNFSAMNANIRRSRDPSLSHTSSTAKYGTLPNSNISRDGSRIIVDNTHKDKMDFVGSRDPSIIRSGSSKPSKISEPSTSSSGLGDSLSDDFSVSIDDGDDYPIKYAALERERTTVLLSKHWSGVIQVEGSGKGSSQASYHGDKPRNMNTFNAKAAQPDADDSNGEITEFHSYQNREDVLKSLANLDNGLRYYKSRKSARKTKIFSGSMAWLTEDGSAPLTSTASVQRQGNDTNYRYSGCPTSNIPSLSEHLYNASWREGQNMRVNFYSHLRKISQIVNAMTQEIPKDLFPFEIKPASLHGHFERRGPRAIDMYLVLVHPTLSSADVQFTFDKELSAEFLLPAASEGLDFFAIRYKDDPTARLSACKLMIVFSYIMSTTIRHLFEADTQVWDRENSRIYNPKIPFPAILQFQAVSEEKTIIDMTFMENELEVTYRVGLLLAVDVESSFPNVLELYSRRQWPTRELKSQLERKGVHLITKIKYSEQHTWHVTFLKTRKLLLEMIDKDGASTAILLAFQVFREKSLCDAGLDGVLMPVHFITLLFWVYSQFASPSYWQMDQVGARFIDILIALKRCLDRKECRDFFLPNLNYFAGIPLEILNRLGEAVDAVIKEPFSYA